jgi:hypothetical protein
LDAMDGGKAWDENVEETLKKAIKEFKQGYK